MFKIGIDIGSTYTKYCILKEDQGIVKLFSEKTPIRQKEYFKKKIEELVKQYDNPKIVSCGYGKKNISSVKMVNELTALAKGTEYVLPSNSIVLDIGGQDTKIIKQSKGELKEFFVSDKCAAGSGLFLANVCNMLSIPFNEIELNLNVEIKLSSVCAVFAQSEIVELISNNVNEMDIISAVIKQILRQSKKLFLNIECDSILLSGGLSQIIGIDKMARSLFDKECFLSDKSQFISSIGCALLC